MTFRFNERRHNLRARFELIVVQRMSKFTRFPMLSLVHRQLPSSCVYTWLTVDRMLCVGGSLDRAVFSVSLFIQAPQSPCQCHHVFITEGNPAAEPWLSYALSSYTATDQSVSLCPSTLLLFSLWFSPPPGVGVGGGWPVNTSMRRTQKYMSCVALIRSDGLFREGSLRVTFSTAWLGVGVDGCPAVVVISLSEEAGLGL